MNISSELLKVAKEIVSAYKVETKRQGSTIIFDIKMNLGKKVDEPEDMGLLVDMMRSNIESSTYEAYYALEEVVGEMGDTDDIRTYYSHDDDGVSLIAEGGSVKLHAVLKVKFTKLNHAKAVEQKL